MKEKDFGKTAMVPTRRNPVMFGVRRGLDSDVSGGQMLVRIQLSADGLATKHLHQCTSYPNSSQSQLVPVYGILNETLARCKRSRWPSLSLRSGSGATQCGPATEL